MASPKRGLKLLNALMTVIDSSRTGDEVVGALIALMLDDTLHKIGSFQIREGDLYLLNPYDFDAIIGWIDGRMKDLGVTEEQHTAWSTAFDMATNLYKSS